MSHATRPEFCSGFFDVRRAVSIISAVVLLCVLGTILFITLRSPLKDDIAWLLYVARRWMAGRELYVDLVEVNPPLIVWISAVPLEISRWLDVDPRFVAMPFFIGSVLGCGWWATALLRPLGGIFADRLPVFAVVGSTLLILPAADLGQREHLLVAAFLPYLVLLARSLDGEAIPFWPALASGILAGLGCALKPRYGLAFAALECLALTRGLRPWRTMPIAAASAMIGYAGLVAIVCPAYLNWAVPMALALYGGTDVSFQILLTDTAPLIAGEMVAVALLWIRRRSRPHQTLMLTLMVFAVASTVVCFIDGKNWYYHRLPATISTVLALAVWIASGIVQRRRPAGAPSMAAGMPMLAAGLAVVMFFATSVRLLEPEAIDALEQRQTAVNRLEEILKAEHARTYIAFSEWIALGFPVVNETGVSWASRFDSMWALKGEIWRARFDPAADREWPIARWVAHDFIAGCPDIAVVDTRETTSYIKVLSSADPAFARAWSRFRPIVAFDGLIVYKRGKGGCRDVWVAAEAEPLSRLQPQSRPETR